LGGFSSRGLGRVRLSDRQVLQVDYTDANQLKAYLIDRKMNEAGDLMRAGLLKVLDTQGG